MLVQEYVKMPVPKDEALEQVSNKSAEIPTMVGSHDRSSANPAPSVCKCQTSLDYGLRTSALLRSLLLASSFTAASSIEARKHASAALPWCICAATLGGTPHGSIEVGIPQDAHELMHCMRPDCARSQHAEALSLLVSIFGLIGPCRYGCRLRSPFNPSVSVHEARLIEVRRAPLHLRLTTMRSAMANACCRHC